MNYKIFFTNMAKVDLEDLYEFLAVHDSQQQADYVLDGIQKVIEGLKELPERGVCPNELCSIGVTKYRELFFKPYRIIYQITSRTVNIILIADGRRDMRSLLEKRILSF